MPLPSAVYGWACECVCVLAMCNALACMPRCMAFIYDSSSYPATQLASQSACQPFANPSSLASAWLVLQRLQMCLGIFCRAPNSSWPEMLVSCNNNNNTSSMALFCMKGYRAAVSRPHPTLNAQRPSNISRILFIVCVRPRPLPPFHASCSFLEASRRCECAHMCRTKAQLTPAIRQPRASPQPTQSPISSVEPLKARCWRLGLSSSSSLSLRLGSGRNNGHACACPQH